MKIRPTLLAVADNRNTFVKFNPGNTPETDYPQLIF